MIQRRFKSIQVPIQICFALMALSAGAMAQEETAIAVVADQVRAQGFACSNPTSVSRDESKSKPDEPAYVLSCEEGSFLVQLVPDQAAKVTAIK